MNKISELINRAMKVKGVSQKEIAELTNVSQPAVGKWISGKSVPAADKFIQIVNYLDLVEEFFPEYKKNSDECDGEVVSLENLVASLDKRVKALENASKE